MTINPTEAPEPLTAAAASSGSERACSVPGCERPHKARGYCRPHYRRWQRHGGAAVDVPIGRGVGYRAAHKHLRAERGAAAGQECAECGGAAALWSYDGTDPHERIEPARGRRYSLDPDRYRPRCRFCHRRAAVDRGAVLPSTIGRAAPDLDVERAARLYQAGASARGIGALLRVSPDAILRALRAHGVPIRPSRRTRHPHRTTPTNSTDRSTPTTTP